MRAPYYRPAARADIDNLLKTSGRMFGPRARRSYKALIDRAIHRFCENPQTRGVQQRQDLPGYSFFHLRHARARATPPKQPRHFIVFAYDDATLTIIRILHDSMDIAQRASEGKDES